MNERPEVKMDAAEDRARAIWGALMVLLSVTDPEACVQAIRQQLEEAFTQGYYAGIEAWDLANKANGSAAPPEDLQ